MRALGWSLSILFFAAPAVLAQQPQYTRPAQAPPLNVPANDSLMNLLQQWEQQMKNIKAIEATVSRTTIDKVDDTRVVYEGTAKLLRPDRAELYLRKKTNPQIYERIVLTGNFLYQFLPQERKLRATQLAPRGAGQMAVDDNFMGLLFGMTAQQALARYDLQLVPKPEDKFYCYLVVTPRLAADKSEFIKARLVLWQKSFLPRQIEFVDSKGDQIIWDVLRIDPNAQLRATDFQKPPLPKDWTFDVQQLPPPPPRGAPGAPPPTTVRPNGHN